MNPHGPSLINYPECSNVPKTENGALALERSHVVCKQMSWHLGWVVQPQGDPLPPPVHTVQWVLMTGFQVHLWSISREDHKGGTLKDVGTEEKNDMKLTGQFSVHA